MNTSLAESDPAVWDIITKEANRQKRQLELIASENFTSRAVREAVGSSLCNKYSEGYPGARYYGGNEFIDQNEELCRQRALDCFGLSKDDWSVNVQPHSGSPANLAVYTGLLKPHDRIMGLDLPHGGHLTHGFMSDKKRISATSVFFESMPYVLDTNTAMIDYDDLEKRARMFRPKMIIAGISAYSHDIDYKRIRSIADAVGAYVLADMSHISGLVAANVVPGPFEDVDIVTTTTHKTLRGPRGGMIFCKKPLASDIDFGVFPRLQGGPHNHSIAGISVALQQAMEPSFRSYQERVVENARVLAQSLQSYGYDIVSGTTNNHMLLVNFHAHGIDGARVDACLEAASIIVNKNSVPGDTKPLVPGGIRLGTPALTTRGFSVDDFRTVASFVHRGIDIAKAFHRVPEKENVRQFKSRVQACRDTGDLLTLREEVEAFAMQFPAAVEE